MKHFPTLYHCHDARSFRPLWALEELAIDYELILMDFPPRFKHEEYLEINPLGTVPSYVDSGILLTESVAICQYLGDKYTNCGLSVSVDHEKYGDYLNWLHRSDATFTFPQTLILRYGKFEKPERRNQQIVDDYTQWVLSRMRSIEAALTDHNYLVANRFTMADICVGYALYLTKLLNLSDHLGSNSAEYLDRLMERDGFQKALDKQSSLVPYL